MEVKRKRTRVEYLENASKLSKGLLDVKFVICYQDQNKKSSNLVDRTEEEEVQVQLISIILRGIIQRSFGQWVHWSCP